jgi:hypothetical protein
MPLAPIRTSLTGRGSQNESGDIPPTGFILSPEALHGPHQNTRSSRLVAAPRLAEPNGISVASGRRSLSPWKRFPPWRVCKANTAGSLGARRSPAHAHTRRRTRRPFSGQTGGLRLLVWETASQVQNGQRGALLTAAIDGSAPLFTPGDEGEGHEPMDEAAGSGHNLPAPGGPRRRTL